MTSTAAVQLPPIGKRTEYALSSRINWQPTIRPASITTGAWRLTVAPSSVIVTMASQTNGMLWVYKHA